MQYKKRVFLKKIKKTLYNILGREGFEPSKALPTDLQSAPFGHSGTSPRTAWTIAFHRKQVKSAFEFIGS